VFNRFLGQSAVLTDQYNIRPEILNMAYWLTVARCGRCVRDFEIRKRTCLHKLKGRA